MGKAIDPVRFILAPGTHYYYNMTPEMRCADMLPWFALVSGGDLVGSGFQMFGRLTRRNLKEQVWFEQPPAPKQSAQVRTMLLGRTLGKCKCN